MAFLEFASRFAESRSGEIMKPRSPAVVVIEFGGGSCNKSGSPSCSLFCNVPEGLTYNPILDPPVKEFVKAFPQVAKLKPAVVSIVPNGESVDTRQKSNTNWSAILQLRDAGEITLEQFKGLDEYFVSQYKFPKVKQQQKMTLAEKLALPIAIGKNNDLNISLTTNGSFLNRDLLKLYGQMGLQTINLSYHPNSTFNPNKYDPALEHLIDRANEAIEADIIPTITHVLTSANADTFVLLADYVTEHDIFFAVGIATARGTDEFSNSQNMWIEPSIEQVKMVFKRLLARKLFADRHIRTSVPYLLVAPYVKNSWVCDQNTDFFHFNFQRTMGKWGLKLNVCSEVRPDEDKQLQDFLVHGKLDSREYLKWRDIAMKDAQTGCKTCIHQCWFEAQSRGGISVTNGNPLDNLELWDYWDTSGKGLRQKKTFRHPIRPIVSVRRDFQKPYLWESLFQGVAREIARMETDDYWQRTFGRAGIDYVELLASCVDDATNPEKIKELIEAETKDRVIHHWVKTPEVTYTTNDDWHDASYPQSLALRTLYLRTQKGGREAGIAIPLKYSNVLRHDSKNNFKEEMRESIYWGKIKRVNSIMITKDNGVLFPLIIRIFLFIFGYRIKFAEIREYI